MTTLILGGTGKTGRRLATRLRNAGADVRTAARQGGDVRFDWDDPATHGPAFAAVDALYLVSPAFRLDHGPQATALLDRAQAAGVAHVTFLSARGVDHAPESMGMRAIELDLGAREGLTSTVLRPAWFMQNFDESFFAPGIAASGVIAAPTGDGAEPFISTEDVAEVAAATLLDPAAHAGAAYTLTGPEALSVGQVAQRISGRLGRPVAHVDLPAEEWVAQAVAGGIPLDYAQLLGSLFETVRAGTMNSVTDDVRRVTGRAPRSFDDYLAEPATVAAWRAPSAVV